MIRGKIIFYIASIVLVSLIISGCVSAPQGTPTPIITTVMTPTATPISTPTPAATVATTVANPSTLPVIKLTSLNVTSYPTSVNGEANVTIQWEVAGGTTGSISQTGVQWGNSANYTRNSTVLTGKSPETFSMYLIAPAGGDFIYFRIYATVDGVDIYSPGYQIAVKPH
ncbi:MAG: hypothetical protein WCE94_00435 [Candidatus Methanoperedens sp.]